MPPASLPATEVPIEEATEAPIQEATEAPIEEVTEAPIQEVTEAPIQEVTEAPIQEAPAEPATVQFDGIILTNGEGMSLYVFTGGGFATCTDDCLNEWPPLLTNGDPIPGNGVDASELGTFTLDDGTTQVLYNEMGLHLFHGDSIPGDINGDGREEWGGRWSLVICNGLVC
jgi:predicted lipoprotein with Yx(FWY)xxD motif